MENQERTAILVIHGIGEQNPFETLDQFVRGLWNAANDYFKLKGDNVYSITHAQVSRQTVETSESWVENYIKLDAGDNFPSINIYEYYWAHQMTEQATIRDIREWLKATSAYASKYYRRNDAIQERFEEPQIRRMFDSAGYVSKRAYLKSLKWYVRTILVLLDLFEQSSIRNLPVLKWILDSSYKKVKKVLVNYVGDVVVYTTTDRKAEHYEVKRRIIQEARKQIESILQNSHYTKVLVAGHSLGSVIAYDTLNRLHTTPGGGDGYEKLRGLVTFGSPLDKIAFFFRQQTRKESYVRRQILDHLHSFKAKDLTLEENPVEIVDGVSHNLKNVYWINFYDPKDPIGDHLDFYKVNENVRLNMGKPWGVAHLAYWEHNPMYRKILETFYRRGSVV
ncbi:MAG: hypothetical protein IH975_04175 [Nitrospinae bacterium]|nr:hypothetical protein [Nitrospinota bacterium]